MKRLPFYQKLLDDSPSTSAILRAVKQWTSALNAPPVHICQGEATLSLFQLMLRSATRQVLDGLNFSVASLLASVGVGSLVSTTPPHPTTVVKQQSLGSQKLFKPFKTILLLSGLVGTQSFMSIVWSLSIANATLDYDITQMYALRASFSA
jgi:hypothetical protein